MITIEAMVTMPPDVVRMRASSTVFVKASSRVNRDLAGMVPEVLQRRPRKCARSTTGVYSLVRMERDEDYNEVL